MLHDVVMNDDDSPAFTRDIAPFGVRMPPDLKERVQAAAKVNNRSMNAEIVATLEREYPAEVYSAEEFLGLLKRLSGELDYVQEIQNQDVLNGILDYFQIGLQAHVHNGEVTLMRQDTKDPHKLK